MLLALTDFRPTGLVAAASTFSLARQGQALQILDLEASQANGSFQVFLVQQLILVGRGLLG
jgi:hypothetical protein